MAADDLPAGTVAGVRAGPWHVLVARTAQGLFALNDRCPHAAARLSKGRLRGAQVMCPLHGARFDLASGACAGNAYPAIRSFAAREESGRIIVTVPMKAPEMYEIPIG